MRLFEKSFFTLGFTFVDNVIALVTSVLIARLLPTSDYGLIQTLYGITALVFNLMHFGIINAANKQVLHSKKKNKIIFNGLFLLIIISIIFLIIGLVVFEPVKNLLEINSSDEILYYLFPLIIFNLLYYYLKVTLITLGKPVLNSFFGVLNIFLYFIPLIVIFLLNTLLVKNVLMYRIISFIIPSVIIVFYLFKKIPKISFKVIKKILGDTRFTFISTTIVIAMNYLSKPILGLISLNEVAYYSVAITYSKILIIFQTGLKSILFPLIGGLAVNKSIKRLKKGLNFWFDLTIKIIIPLSFILIILSEDVINLIFSNKYQNANYFTLFTILGAAISLLCLPESAIFLGLNKLKDKNKYNFYTAIIYLPILLILTLLFSGLGAALSYLMLSLINLVLFLFFLKKYNIKLEIKRINSIIIPLITLILFYMFKFKIIPIILIISYSLMSFKLNWINEDTKKYILKKLKERKINKYIIWAIE